MYVNTRFDGVYHVWQYRHTSLSDNIMKYVHICLYTENDYHESCYIFFKHAGNVLDTDCHVH